MSFDQEKKQELSHEEYTASSIEETVSDVDFEKATMQVHSQSANPQRAVADLFSSFQPTS